MAKKKPASDSAKAKPVEAGHDVVKAVRDIVANSPVPLTLKQINARHEAAHKLAAGPAAVEDSVLELVKDNKLKLAGPPEKKVTLTREAVELLLADQPAGTEMTLNATTVGALIDDEDPEVAVKQFLGMHPAESFSNVKIFERLRALGKTDFTQGAINDALDVLVQLGTVKHGAGGFSCA